MLKNSKVKKLFRFLLGDKGAAAIEYAVALPIFLTLVAGVIQFGIYMVKEQTLAGRVASIALAMQANPEIDPSDWDELVLMSNSKSVILDNTLDPNTSICAVASLTSAPATSCVVAGGYNGLNYGAWGSATNLNFQFLNSLPPAWQNIEVQAQYSQQMSRYQNPTGGPDNAAWQANGLAQLAIANAYISAGNYMGAGKILSNLGAFPTNGFYVTILGKISNADTFLTSIKTFIPAINNIALGVNHATTFPVTNITTVPTCDQPGQYLQYNNGFICSKFGQTPTTNCTEPWQRLEYNSGTWICQNVPYVFDGGTFHLTTNNSSSTSMNCPTSGMPPTGFSCWLNNVAGGVDAENAPWTTWAATSGFPTNPWFGDGSPNPTPACNPPTWPSPPSIIYAWNNYSNPSCLPPAALHANNYWNGVGNVVSLQSDYNGSPSLYNIMGLAPTNAHNRMTLCQSIQFTLPSGMPSSGQIIPEGNLIYPGAGFMPTGGVVLNGPQSAWRSWAVTFLQFPNIPSSGGVFIGGNYTAELCESHGGNWYPNYWNYTGANSSGVPIGPGQFANPTSPGVGAENIGWTMTYVPASAR